MLKYMKTDPVRKAKAVYSEFAIARESATVTRPCFGGLKGGQGSRKAL